MPAFTITCPPSRRLGSLPGWMREQRRPDVDVWADHGALGRGDRGRVVGSRARIRILRRRRVPRHRAPQNQLDIGAFDLGFEPSAITVTAEGTYEVAFSNTGAIPHDITFADGTTIPAAPGATSVGSVTIPAGGLTFICSIPGHEQAGMKGSVTVAGAAATPDPDSHGGPDTVDRRGRGPGRSRTGHLRPDCAAAPGGRRPRHRARDDRARDDRRARASSRRSGRSAGPSPARSSGSRSATPCGSTSRTRPPARCPTRSTSMPARSPGTTRCGRSRPARSCSTSGRPNTPAYGCTTAAPPRRCITSPTACTAWSSSSRGTAAQGRQGVRPRPERVVSRVRRAISPASTRLLPRRPRPTSSSSTASPTNTWTRRSRLRPASACAIFVLDAGPSIDSSFHIVGTIFDTVIKEGIAPGEGQRWIWGSQAVDLSPAQGAIVEFTTAEDGLYPLVTHAFNFVGRGALGMLQAGDGDPTN